LYLLGLPENADKDEYCNIYKITEGLDPLPMTRLAALLTDEEQVCILSRDVNRF
jgi:hypothetical protein